MTCQGPVVIRNQADLRSVTAICSSIDGELFVLGADLAGLDELERLRASNDAPGD